MNTYKTKSQRILAIVLAILILMPTQAMAAVANRISKKPEIIIDSTPQKKSGDIVISTDSTELPHFNIDIISSIDDTDPALKLVKWYVTVENNKNDAVDPSDKTDERSLDATFFISKTSSLKNLKIEKVYNTEGKAVPHTKRVNIENRKDDLLDTMGISTRVPSKITYYLTAEIENPSDIYTLDYSFKTSYDDFKLTKRHAIDSNGVEVALDEIKTSKQTYKDDEKTIFTDFIISESSDTLKENDTRFEYEIAPETKNSRIVIEYYKSTEEGFVKDESKTPIVLEKPDDKFEIDLEEGELAKVVTETKSIDLVPEKVEAQIPMANIAPQSPEITEEPKTKFEIEKAPEVAPTTVEIEKPTEVAPEIIVEEKEQESIKPEITIEEPSKEPAPIIIEETKPIFTLEPKKESVKRPEIKIEENILGTNKELQAPKTKLVLDKLEGSKEDVKIELETRREELDKKIATLDAEKEKAKTTLATSKPEITLGEKEEKFSLDKSLKTGDDLMANIESSEITENDLAIVVNELGIETEKSAKETLAEKLVSGELSEDELKIYLEDLILRKELSTEEIQLVIDSIGNEYDLNTLELKEILRLATEKLNNNNEKIIETLKEHGIALDLKDQNTQISQSEVIRLLVENGKTEKQAREIASTLFEKTGYELNPEKVLRDALANKTLTREELENLIDEIVKEYGIDKTEVERIIDRLNLEDSSKEELVKDIIELNSNDEEISLNLVKSRLYNIIKTFELNDDERLAIIENLKGSTKGEILKSLDETLPTYGFGEVDIERIKTNIFTEVESYELVEKLREILTPYAVTELQVLEILDRIFLNPNLTPDELRVRIKEVLPEYNFGTEDIEKITNELLPLETKTPVELLKELLDSGELTYDKLVEFLKELKEKHNLSDDEIAGLVNDNRTQIEELIDDKTLTDTLFSNVNRLKVTKFAYEVIYNNGETTGVKEVLNDEPTTEEIEEVEEKGFIAKVLEPLTELFSKDDEAEDTEEEIQTIKIEETQKSQYELKSPEEVEVESAIRELLTTRSAEDITFDELSKVLAEKLPYIDLAQINIMSIFYNIVNPKKEIVLEKSAEQKLSEILQNSNLDNEILIKELRELKNTYNLSDEELKKLLENNIDRINEVKGDFTIEEILAAAGYVSENTVLIATDFGPKKFHLLTEVNVLASTGWQIPAGYYFDINIGPYLKPGTNTLKSLTDESGKVIATPSYDPNTNIIRYTFPSAVTVTKNLKIDQYLDFNVDKIPQDADDVNINISVKPKNGVLQSLPTIKVNKNDQNPSTLIPGGKTPGISTDTSGDSYRKTYPYDIDYWAYQYYDQEKNTINWDIQIETHQVNLDHLNFYNLGLALYAPEAQGLENYKVTIRSYPKDMTVTERSLVKKQTTPTTGIDYETAGTLTKNGDSNLLTYNKSFEKGGINNKKLPEDLFIHVEAAPIDTHAKYQMYDLGMRLTPDVNYINDIVQEFKDDWAKLVSMMPWIIPYKDGEAFAKKFEDGFNVVDTRLPADAMVAAYYDNKHTAKSYTDKSRSVFGEFTSATSKTVNWQISDTLRLQDTNERFVNGTSSLGSDVFSTEFNSNNNTPGSIKVEVLEPNKDGSFTKILSGEYSSDSALRTDLSKKRPVLVPGTIVNYVFTKTTKNDTVDSTATINFIERFDDGAGTYGGKQTVTLRRLTEKEQSSIVHVAQYNDEPTWMIIRENGEFAFCINYGKQYPIIQFTGDNIKIHQKNIKNATMDDLNNYAGFWASIKNDTGYYDKKDDRNKARMYDEIKRALYLVENTDFKSEKEKYYVAQILIFRIIDIYSTPKLIQNPDDAYNENTTVGQTVINGNLPSESGLYTQIANPFKEHREKANEIFKKIPETKKETSNYYISPADVNEAVEINIYPTFEDGTGDKKDFQTVISYKAKNPLRINKVDSDNKPISGVSFNISGNGKNITYTSGNEPSKFYLPVGKYAVTETNTPQGYNTIEPFTIEVKEETNSVERAWYDKRREESGSTTYFYPSNTAVISENNNYYVDQSGERKSLVNVESKYINDFKEYQSSLNIINTKGRLEISKKLLAADGEYHDLPGIEFELKKKFSLETRKAKTDKNGIAIFDNLPLNSEWTLEEVKMDGLSEVFTKWNVSVDSSGNVKITGNKDSRDPDNLFTIDSSDSSKITVINKPDRKEELGKFKIKKVNESGNPIPKAGFTLYKNKNDVGSKIKEEAFTNELGEIYYSNVPYGTYWLKETTVPKGYQIPSEENLWIEVTVNKDTQGSGEVVVNPGDLTDPEQPDNPNPTNPENPVDPTPEPQPEKMVLKSRIVTNNTSGSINDDSKKLADITASLEAQDNKDIVNDYNLNLTIRGDSISRISTSRVEKDKTVDVLFLVERSGSSSDSINAYNNSVGNVLNTLKNRNNLSRIGTLYYDTSGVENKANPLVDAKSVSSSNLNVNYDKQSGRAQIHLAYEKAKEIMKESSADYKIVVAVPSGNSLNENFRVPGVGLDASVNEIFVYSGNSSGRLTQNTYYNSGLKLATSSDNVVVGTTGWFDKVNTKINNLQKTVTTETTTVTEPAINGQTITLTPGQGFEITGNNTFSLPKLNKGQVHTINTTVRLTGSNPGNYNVLENIAVTNGSINISSPSVEIYEEKVASSKPLFKNLFTTTVYAAEINFQEVDRSNENENSSIIISNDEKLSNDFLNVYTYKITNKSIPTGSYPYTGGPGESIMFLAMGAVVMTAGAVYYGKKKREY